MQCLPLDLPDIDTLNLVEQITEHDCTHACFAETKFRSDRFKAMMQIDQCDDFCKTTYKILKAKKTETLSEVPVAWHVEASLLRPKPGYNTLKMDTCKDIPTFAALRFGEARILFQSQDGCRLYFKLLDVFLPAGGTLHVDYTAIAPKEIGGEFEQFWSKMWLRDTRAEQFELTPWESFDELLQDVDLPVIPEIAYPIDDINLWMHLVKSLPPAEAVGPCGWSNDELKALPECCIRDFVNIFAAVMNHGFGPGMMAAKTNSFVKKILSRFRCTMPDRLPF